MSKIVKISILMSIFFFVAINFADPINLSTWSDQQYDVDGYQNAGNWVLAPDNLSVTQTVNADPSMYLNGINQTSFLMDGSWQVNTASDDDFMGFVFGYQDASHFYLMDWKQGQQDYVGRRAYEGFTIKKFSAASKDDLTLTDFWSSTDTDNMKVLTSSYGSDKGWADNTSYDFHLDFSASGQFSVLVKEEDEVLWNVSVNDNSYTSGEFGFYNFSQSTVQYSGFEQTGGVPVPEPSTTILLGLGLFSLIFYRKTKS